MSLKALYKTLYAQVLAGIVSGVALGYTVPEYGAAMKPLGDGFIMLVRMMIAPIVFCTVVTGIAQTRAMKDVGRIGVRALVYFEVVATLALLIGLAVVKLLKPGAGIALDSSALDMAPVAAYATASKTLTTTEFVLNLIPNTVVDAFARGEILQVLLFSVMVGLAFLRLGDRVRPLVALIDQASKALFAIMAMIMYVAPIGAFGAMAFTVGRYGIGTLLSLGQLMADVYLTCILFVFIVLAAIVRVAGFSLWKMLTYIREEILIVVGTASSESVLPRVMQKLERLGCSKPVVGLVIPTGYSFNLDGTSIYMAMAAMFVAQVSGVQLSFREELSLFGILLLTSKGAAALPGGGFITLAATLSVFPSIPMGGLALLLGVDRFMSEVRALTNMIGNAVATVVVARWEGAIDLEHARAVLNGGRAHQFGTLDDDLQAASVDAAVPSSGDRTVSKSVAEMP